MIELWDDRAFQVELNTGRIAVLPELPRVLRTKENEKRAEVNGVHAGQDFEWIEAHSA